MPTSESEPEPEPGSEPQPEPPPLPASLAERYTLERQLAMGGSAEVWQGVDRVLERPVAVKVLHRHLLTDETTRARLTQEARAAAALSDPGIVAIYDVAVDPDAAAIILELIEGESLAQRLQRERILPPRAAARIGAEVAEALDHAHQRGVIHRDVKAANVLIGKDGEVKLVDFGIARILADEATHLTAEGTVTGTLRYMAPEQLRGEDVGPAADIYATGILLAEMLTGEAPFEATTPVELLEAQQTPPMAFGDAPPELAAIVRKALDPEPDRRHASAGALATDLRSWLEADAAPAVAGAPDDVTQAAVVVPVVAASAAPGDVPSAPDPVPVPEPIPASDPMPLAPDPMPAAAAHAVSGEDDHARAASDDDRQVATWTVIGIAIAIAAVLFVLTRGDLGLFGSGSAASPSPVTTPSVTAVPTTAPTPTPVPAPLTLEAAFAQFRQTVEAGQQNGQIEEGAAEELMDRAERFLEDDLNGGDINKASRELHRAIDELEHDGEISAELAASLRQMADELEAAARRQS
jgi:eukaryotic-like serine/threonine-protein kinase